MPMIFFHPWTTLKLGALHVAIWLILGLTTSIMAIHTCLEYNKIAGTDLTKAQMSSIGVAVFLGPLVGPIANPGATGEFAQARQLTFFLFIVVLAGTSPFLIIRRQVSKVVALGAWLGFVSASVVWFFGALLSLGLFLF